MSYLKRTKSTFAPNQLTSMKTENMLQIALQVKKIYTQTTWQK